MTIKALESLTELLATGGGNKGGMSGQEQGNWLDKTSERLREQVTGLFEAGGEPAKQVEDILHGAPFGHPLHPALILLPAGAWTTAAFLDLLGIEEGADASIGLGVLSSVPAALAGLADWGYTRGKARNLGLVHATLNTLALGLYAWSWADRRAGNRGRGQFLSTFGLAAIGVSGYLGGEISYSLGYPVNRTAWDPGLFEPSDQIDQFHVAASAASLKDGQLAPGEVSIDGTTIPLVLLKRGHEVFALAATCAHLGGPLQDGTLVDGDCVECPWHGSRFSFQDGRNVRGPSAYPQPRYEARIRDSNVEVRLAH